MLLQLLREHITEEKNRFCSAWGGVGGVRALPEFFDPFFPPCCPLYFDINIMLCDTWGERSFGQCPKEIDFSYGRSSLSINPENSASLCHRGSPPQETFVRMRATQK